MSCPTIAIFENNKEGTQKKVHINLGWFSPIDFELSRIIIGASKNVSDTYEWDRVVLPIIGSYMTREKFDKMVVASDAIEEFRTIDLTTWLAYTKRFTLKNIWIQQ